MAGDQPPTGPAPRFPIYLLPSFNLPFPRLRQRSSSPAGYASSPPRVEHLPSLSSSPGASSLSSSSPAGQSPPAPSYLASRPSFSSFSKGVRAWALPPPPSSSLSSSSSSSSSSAAAAAVSLSRAGRLARAQPDTIRCSTCATDLAFRSQIVSKGFTGRYGRAYLVSAAPRGAGGSGHKDKTGTGGDLVNIKVGRPETRLLATGSHVVADITCATCHAKLGWKYVDAKEEAQRYKVGKFILETQRVVDHRVWEDVDVNDDTDDCNDDDDVDVVVVDDAGDYRDQLPCRPGKQSERKKMKKKKKKQDDDDEATDPATIVFDSDDEDECEDIFAGTWDPEVVAKRRSRKVSRRARQD